jgi:hypothetical protein
LLDVKLGLVTVRKEHTLRMLESWVLGQVFGAKREEVTGGLRKLHNGKLHDLFSSLNIIRVRKSRRMRWTGHVARIEVSRDACRFFGALGMDRRVVLQWIFRQ